LVSISDSQYDATTCSLVVLACRCITASAMDQKWSPAVTVHVVGGAGVVTEADALVPRDWGVSATGGVYGFSTVVVVDLFGAAVVVPTVDVVDGEVVEGVDGEVVDVDVAEAAMLVTGTVGVGRPAPSAILMRSGGGVVPDGRLAKSGHRCGPPSPVCASDCAEAAFP
jgi:hypothetical protein